MYAFPQGNKMKIGSCALEEFPVPPEQIYMDKLSGKDFNRPQYQKLIRKIRPDDVIVIKSIDRLGRNYSEILEQWQAITKRSTQISLCSTCLCLTPAKIRT